MLGRNALDHNVIWDRKSIASAKQLGDSVSFGLNSELWRPGAHVRFAWRSAREEKMLGSIERGKYADLVVLNGDYMAVPEDRIDELEPILTIVGGKVVFEAPAR